MNIFDDTEEFKQRREKEIMAMGEDAGLKAESLSYVNKAARHNYSYHFDWMGLPIIQYPQDIVAMQEIIFNVKPGFIIETGVARGGSVVFYASMLELCGCADNAKVIGIDIDIRKHNRRRVENHPMFKNICLIEGSSTDSRVLEQVDGIIEQHHLNNGLVVLDSLHTHSHVLSELRLYSKYVGEGGYMTVFDTIVEHLDEEGIGDRPWSKGNSPKTAVDEFLKENGRFVINTNIENKLLITNCPGGYLKCVKPL